MVRRAARDAERDARMTPGDAQEKQEQHPGKQPQQHPVPQLQEEQLQHQRVTAASAAPASSEAATAQQLKGSKVMKVFLSNALLPKFSLTDQLASKGVSE